ncbi:MAG: hypothetical protein CMO80_13865 [Verrucomicrobiales bacterium]|nr:hypothetical protein [Verrucomicrobiales bacterium]
MVNLRFNTYDCAVGQNNQLIKTQAELNERNQQLCKQQEQLRVANEKLSELARKDGLTGLNNHRTFKERLEDEYNRSFRHGLRLSLLILDADKFKPFNDTFGHPAGDEVLKTVAGTLTEATRNTDFVARYGGEEFVVLLPFTERDAGLGLAERVRAQFESEPWEQGAIAVSVGVGTMIPDIKTPAELVAQADEVLYHSNLTGRNRVTHMDELPHKEPGEVPEQHS